MLVATLCVAMGTVVSTAGAQSPPVSPPGGVLPPTPQSTRPALAAPVAPLVIPGVNDRPLGLTQGPKLMVKAFRLEGATDLPKYRVRVSEAQKILNEALAKEPPEGYAINQLQAIAGKVADYYHAKGLVLAQAFVPAQTVRDGTVVIEVLPATLASVHVVGNNWYPAWVLSRPLNGLIDQPIDKDAVESALLTINQYPGVTAVGVLAAGRELGTSDLTLRVENLKRVVVDLSADNEGVTASGKYRAQLGVTLNDPFGLGDELQLSGMYEFDPSTSAEHGVYGGATYTVPTFSARDLLVLSYFTNAYVVGGLESNLQLTKPKGNSSIGEVGYRHDFAPSRLGSASLGLAFDLKRATFSANGTKLFKDDLSTAHLDFNWSRIDTRFRGVNQLLLTYEHGFKSLLGSLGDYNPTALPNASRVDATGQFNRGALSLQRLQRITSNVSLLLHVQGQDTNDPLVSLEQLSLAGPEAVRAYPVASLLVDKGAVGTAELMVGAPGFASRPAFAGRTWGETLQFSVFIDYAEGWINDYMPLEFTTASRVKLGGWGGAVQFNVPNHIFARVDIATPITARLPGMGTGPQYFFRVGVSF
jgi:hemolysin activation/secretion protein